MLTFKQLDAVFWVAEMGGFSHAAKKLNTTQSAISKRISELEESLGIQLFERHTRKATLTEKGEEMFVLAKKMLDQRNATIEQLLNPSVIERRLRLGVTELTAMTWLPKLVEVIRTHYPRVTLEPEVETSVTLRDKLMEDETDLIFVPDAFDHDNAITTRIGQVENVWMCKPGYVKGQGTIRLADLAHYNLLTQGPRSGTGLIYARWLKSKGISSKQFIETNSMIALMGLTRSGIGVSYLPKNCMQFWSDQAQLQEIKVTPPLPPTQYVAMYRRNQPSNFLASIVMLSQMSCDFSASA